MMRRAVLGLRGFQRGTCAAVCQKLPLQQVSGVFNAEAWGYVRDIKHAAAQRAARDAGR